MIFEGTTTDRDMGWQHIFDELRKADSAFVDAGLFEGETLPGSEYTVAQIGAVNEFGTKPETIPMIPERSFIRATVDENDQQYSDLFDELMWAALTDNRSAFSAMTAFGEYVASDIKRAITVLQEPPNADITIKRKGSSNPLIDQGYMRAAVRSRITMGAKTKMTAKSSRSGG